MVTYRCSAKTGDSLVSRSHHVCSLITCLNLDQVPGIKIIFPFNCNLQISFFLIIVVIVLTVHIEIKYILLFCGSRDCGLCFIYIPLRQRIAQGRVLNKHMIKLFGIRSTFSFFGRDVLLILGASLTWLLYLNPRLKNSQVTWWSTDGSYCSSFCIIYELI